MPLVFLAFLLLVLAGLVVLVWGMGASRLTAGPRAREPSLRFALVSALRALPAGAVDMTSYDATTSTATPPTGGRFQPGLSRG